MYKKSAPTSISIFIVLEECVHACIG